MLDENPESRIRFLFMLSFRHENFKRAEALCSPGVSGIFGVMDVREEKFVVRTYECGADGKIKITSLMQYLQEAAALHAEQLGFGFEKLSGLEGYWVLSNIRVEITRLPMWNDQVIVRTWPSGYSRSVATREFIGRDRNGGEIFRAGSEWMVLSKRTNRLKNLFRLDLGLPKTGQKALPNELNRLELQEDYRSVERVRVPYSSIDLNGHVNNTEYVRWGVDAMRRAFRPKGDIRSLQATYLSEIFEDDEVEIAVSLGGNGKFHVLASKPGEGSAVYLMEVIC
jgi:medium-chain acyl-[acyl-carrier-protein] hydrolase